jgi:proteasome lid subunit RPN8/RPN11
MWASDAQDMLLGFGRRQWRAMIAELARRGAGTSEAGAFLLAERDGDRRRVTRIVYLDDLDPNCLQGAIRFDGLAYSTLWDICEAEGRVVVGDVHSHPHAGVRQSPEDQESPMVARDGHVAIIVPHLAMRLVKPAQAGVHLYAGDDGWISWYGRDAARRLRLRWWR